MFRGYKYRIYPNDEQKVFIAKCCGARRFVYNYALGKSIEAYEATKDSDKPEYYNKFAMSKVIRSLPDTPDENGEFPYSWLREIDSILIGYALADLDLAYKAFFRNLKKGVTSGFPKFKSKNKSNFESYTTQKASNSDNIKIIDDKYIKLPKITPIKIKLHRPVEGKIKRATVYKTASGNYYVSLLCEVPDQILENDGGVVGVNVGISCFYMDSNGKVVENPKYFEKSEKRLKKLQRQLSHLEKSHIKSYTEVHKKDKNGKDCVSRRPNYDCDLKTLKNRDKLRKKIAKVHEHIANQRAYFHEVESLRLAKENSIVCMEDLDIKSMQQDNRLAKKISDASWYSFRQKVDYKVKNHGGVAIFVPTDYPSSQLCEYCGYKNPIVKNLSVRHWTCPECGAEHKRELNAAHNILTKGIKIGLENEHSLTESEELLDLI